MKRSSDNNKGIFLSSKESPFDGIHNQYSESRRHSIANSRDNIVDDEESSVGFDLGAWKKDSSHDGSEESSTEREWSSEDKNLGSDSDSSSAHSNSEDTSDDETSDEASSSSDSCTSTRSDGDDKSESDDVSSLEKLIRGYNGHTDLRNASKEVLIKAVRNLWSSRTIKNNEPRFLHQPTG
jgi:hypothetical protein